MQLRFWDRGLSLSASNQRDDEFDGREVTVAR
jgi:hypothetical protein